MPFIVDPVDEDSEDVAAMPEPAYTVALRDFPDLPDKERMANAAARQAGLQGLGEPAEAYFDVRLT